MRRFLILTVLTVVAGAAYVAMPFVSAWNIREAIHRGDKTYLADRIEWESLKTSLKPSLTRLALDMPLEPDTEPAKKPGLWQRIKQRWGRPFAERAIDGYVTPEGLTQLFSLRQMYRDKVANTPDVGHDRPLAQRVQAFWSRVKRAEFQTPTRFELDVVDRNVPGRMFAGVLELRGLTWKLTELRIRDSDAGNRPDSDGAAPETGGDQDERLPPNQPMASAPAAEGSPLER